MMSKLHSSVQWTQKLRARVWHRINRRWVFYTHRCIDLEYTRLGFYTGWTDAKEIAYVGALTDEDRGNSIHRLNRCWRNCIRWCIDLEQFWSVLHSPVEPTLRKLYTSVHWQMKTEENTYTGWTDDAPVNLIGSVVQRGDFHGTWRSYTHRLNRRYIG